MTQPVITVLTGQSDQYKIVIVFISEFYDGLSHGLFAGTNIDNFWVSSEW